MAIVTNVRWSGGQGGSLELEVDGHPAFIPTDKEWWAKLGYVYIIFVHANDDDLGLLPSAHFPATKHTSDITLTNCIRSPKLVRYLFDLHEALADIKIFENGKLIDPGPFEV